MAFLFYKRVENMDIYNMSHCKDLTAAIAIARVDRAKRVLPKMWPGLTYRIGEVFRLKYVDGVVRAWRMNRT